MLTALQLEPLVKSGALSRQDQMNAMWSAAGDGIRRNWVKMLAVTVVVSLLPGLGPVLGVASIFGGVFMVNKLARSFWLSLSAEQRADLEEAANKAGVKLPGQDNRWYVAPLLDMTSKTLCLRALDNNGRCY